jgi:hypothetical protein
MAAPYLALANTLKAGALQVVRLYASLRRHGAIYKAPEDIARHADDALIFADPDAELDSATRGAPVRIGRKRKNTLDLRGVAGHYVR